MRTRICNAFIVVGAALAVLAAAPAETPLRIAFADPVSSLDPQLNNNAGDRSVDMFFFDFLVNNNEVQGRAGLQPALATAWRATGPLTWEFDLRRGVRWHDGVEFTSDDVLFSYARAPHVPGSVASFAGFLHTVERVEAMGPYGVRITTTAPNPNLPLNLASVHIVSRHVGEHASSEDYNTGRALVGTGPYRFVSYTPGARVEMRRNEDYWGQLPSWEGVDYRYVANPASRTAALLSGDVDVIDKVSVADVAKLKAEAKQGGAMRVYAYPGLRVLLLQPGFGAGPNRYVTGPDGAALAVNPMADVRVRRALNMAINRPALADRLLQGTATAADQWMPAKTFGFNPAVHSPGFDPEGARRLLAEAGYPAGFRLVMHIPADRYVAGSETAQAVAQMWSRIGVRTSIETLTWTVYSSQVTRGEFAMTMIAWGNGTGEAGYGLLNILATQDAAKGQGVSNWGHYSNPAVDHDLDEATAAFDERAREGFLQDAARLVDADVGIFPLFHYQNIWAARRGLVVRPQSSDRTLATMVTREQE